MRLGHTRREATSYRLQATSYQLQATSCKLPATSYQLPATSYKLPATSYQPQATSHKPQANKPQSYKVTKLQPAAKGRCLRGGFDEAVLEGEVDASALSAALSAPVH